MSARRGTESTRARATSSRLRPGRRARFKNYTLELMRTGRLPAFVLSVGLAVILSAFALADDFSVETVIIRGNSIAYADSIVENSGALGESVFHIAPDRIANRVADHPVVASARVRTELPDRMIINVVEREPALVWQAGERAVLVDEYGWVLAEGDSETLPRVVDLDGELPKPGTSMSARAVEASRYLLAEFGDAVTLEYDEREGFLVHLEDDRVISFGDASELPVKRQVVRDIQAMDADWTRLDVRDPERPYYQE